MRTWPARRWAVAAAVAASTILLIGVPTALIPNPVFGRSVEATWWSWPVLVVTAVLAGLVSATYVATPTDRDEAAGRAGLAGGFLAYLAVGCPACNKLALIALGSTGAVQWFAPWQPVLAVAGIVALAYALRRRLQGERACPVRPVPAVPADDAALPASSPTP